MSPAPLEDRDELAIFCDDEDARFAALEAQQRAVQSEIKAFSGADRLSRDDVHERVRH